MAKTVAEPILVAYSLRNLGVLSHSNHNFEMAQTLGEQALTILLNSAPESEGMFDVCLLLGETHVRKGEVAQALQYCQDAEKLASQSQNIYQKAAVFKVLGNVYLLGGKFEKSIDYYKKSQTTYRMLNDYCNEAMVLNNMSHCYHLMERYSDALACGKFGLTIYEQHQHSQKLPRRVHAYLMNNMGNAYVKLKRYDKAEQLFYKALELYATEPNVYGEIYSWRGLGEVALHQARLDESLNNLRKALQFAKTYDVSVELARTHRILTTVYKSKGDFESALKHHELFFQFQQKAMHEEQARALKNLEMAHQIQEAEKETEIYQLKNVALQHEIRERELAEQEASKQTNYFKVLLQNSPFAILTLDLQGRVEAHNQAFFDLFKHPTEALIQRPFSQIFHHSSDQSPIASLVELMNQGHTINQQLRLCDYNGKPIDIEFYAVPISYDIQPLGYLVHFHDIRPQLEKERLLTEAKNKAQAAAKAKSEFLANMSHEIRTPLNGIIGVTEMLNQSQLSAQQRDLTSIIMNSGESLLVIINDILDFSKIDAGKLELEHKPFSLAEAIEDTLDLLAHSADSKGLELGYVLSPQTPAHLIGDVVRFRQIMLNLLSNGIKFTHSGHIFVIVDGERIENETATITVEVRDTGVGISSAAQHRLFRSFSQVDASVTRKYGGTGLGLAICKQLTDLMNGRIWVKSELGRGSSFFFTVQLPIAPPTVQRTTCDKEGQPTAAILVDHPLLVQGVEAHLRRMNITPIPAESGYNIQNLIDQQNPDVLIVDMKSVKNMMGTHSMTNISVPLIILKSISDPPPFQVSGIYYLSLPVRQQNLEDQLCLALGFRSAKKKQMTANLKQTHIDPLASIKPLRILLAEDNKINQRVTQTMLGKLGYHIDIVENGRLAVEAASSTQYDLILMDIQMPEMDGVTATQQIQARVSLDKKPFIVAMTANAMKGDKENFLGQGMDSYISKPVRLADLELLLRSVPTRDRKRPSSTPAA